MWVVGTGNWNGPARITNTYQSSPGAPVVSMKQLPNQLDAFFSGLRGGLWVAWVVDAGLWSGPISLTQTGLPVDVTVSLWRNPSTTDRQTYEEIIDHFADGVFESSNGANRLRNIFIYTGGGKRDCTDIIWDSMGWPQASASGTALGCGEQLQMFDTFNGSTPTNFLTAANRQYGGYTLAHEFGHYFYGLYDEYSDSKTDCAKVGLITPCKDDQPVNNSMMRQQQNAVGGTTTNTARLSG